MELAKLHYKCHMSWFRVRFYLSCEAAFFAVHRTRYILLLYGCLLLNIYLRYAETFRRHYIVHRVVMPFSAGGKCSPTVGGVTFLKIALCTPLAFRFETKTRKKKRVVT